MATNLVVQQVRAKSDGFQRRRGATAAAAADLLPLHADDAVRAVC